MLTVLSVFGTRPEAIKMAPVVKALEQQASCVRSVVCVTGQHREMLDQVLKLFAIKPDVDLQVMQPNQTLSRLTGLLFEKLDGVVQNVKPDWILAQGDTTTAMVAGLVSFYHRVKFGHVEAGLRTGDKWRPFPEEVNRRVADLVADAYFAPTERARQALLKEGCDPAAIFVTGNTVIDALLDVAARPFDWKTSACPSLSETSRLVLITAHRRESFGKPFRELCLAIRDLAIRFGEVQFLYPVHLNPNVRQPVVELLVGLPNVHLAEPVDYFCMVHLMKRAELLLTDSGGVQEEAPTFGVPVLVMRDTTERPEGVEAGVCRLVGTDRQRIVSEASSVLQHGSFVDPALRGTNPYGDGQAGRRIVAVLLGESIE
jgi:UDP-N-acetylglucosamine 2-epimerase